jgi:hypothetical protein
MRPEFAVPGAFALAALIAFVATPVAIRVARATSFFDLPVGYSISRRRRPDRRFPGGSIRVRR